MKKHLSKYFLLAVLSCSMLLNASACKDDDSNSSTPDDNGGTETPTNNVSFTTTPKSLGFTKVGGTINFTVNSDNSVVAIALDSWITIAQKSTSNPYSFDVTVDALSDNNSRYGNIIVASNGDSDTVKVSQYADYTIGLSTRSINVASTASSVEFTVDCPVSYTVSCSQTWLSEASADGTKYSYNVEASQLARPRTGYIVIATDDNSDTVRIIQEAGKTVTVSSASTAMDIAQLMYPGWNLGNTMEATGGETAWQSTKTTQQIIDYVQECGFNAIRIPCSWYGHATKNSSGKYVISSTWMSRVKEVVDYCMNDGIFVELNDHWDSGWLEVLGFSKSSDSYSAVDQEWIDGKIVILKDLWTQIAEEFKDYDNHLLFAGLNEPFQEYNLFNDKHSKLTPILEQYNQAFVDAVRATGGNNATRILVVQGPGASLWDTESMLTMPTDNVANKLMVEGHYYEPWNFCGESTNPTYTWNAESTVKGLMEKLKAKFCDKGIPVLIGEYGANWRDYSQNQAKHDESIKNFFKAISQWGPSNGCLPFVWDINNCPSTKGKGGTMTIINRAKLSIYSTPSYEGIMEGTSAVVWPY